MSAHTAIAPSPALPHQDRRCRTHVQPAAAARYNCRGNHEALGRGALLEGVQRYRPTSQNDGRARSPLNGRAPVWTPGLSPPSEGNVSERCRGKQLARRSMPGLRRTTTRLGKLRAVSSWGIGRRLRAARYARKSTALQRRSLVPSSSPVSVSSDTPSKGSIAMLARNQLAGTDDHTIKWRTAQRAHCST